MCSIIIEPGTVLSYSLIVLYCIVFTFKSNPQSEDSALRYPSCHCWTQDMRPGVLSGASPGITLTSSFSVAVGHPISGRLRTEFRYYFFLSLINAPLWNKATVFSLRPLENFHRCGFLSVFVGGHFAAAPVYRWPSPAVDGETAIQSLRFRHIPEETASEWERSGVPLAHVYRSGDRRLQFASKDSYRNIRRGVLSPSLFYFLLTWPLGSFYRSPFSHLRWKFIVWVWLFATHSDVIGHTVTSKVDLCKAEQDT